MNINVYTDGGARGNPGVSGYGLVVFDDDKNIVYQESKFLGIKTNNEAEYLALLGALNWIDQNKTALSISNIKFSSDSQLLVRQFQGIYKVKSPNLIPLFSQACQLLLKIKLPYKFEDIRREFNKVADELANQAMDRKS